MNMMQRWNLNDGLLPATLGGLNELFRSVFDVTTDFGPEWLSDRIGALPLDMECGEKDVTVKIPLPGCNAEEINVEVVNDILTVKAERSEEKNDDGEEKHYLRRERSSMSYEESVKLPARVRGHEASASYQDGILTVVLPREEENVDKAHVVKVQ